MRYGGAGNLLCIEVHPLLYQWVGYRSSYREMSFFLGHALKVLNIRLFSVCTHFNSNSLVSFLWARGLLMTYFCLCCHRPLLRYIRHQRLYFFCLHCWAEMPALVSVRERWSERKQSFKNRRRNSCPQISMTLFKIQIEQIRRQRSFAFNDISDRLYRSPGKNCWYWFNLLPRQRSIPNVEACI